MSQGDSFSFGDSPPLAAPAVSDGTAGVSSDTGILIEEQGYSDVQFLTPAASASEPEGSARPGAAADRPDLPPREDGSRKAAVATAAAHTKRQDPPAAAGSVPDPSPRGDGPMELAAGGGPNAGNSPGGLIEDKNSVSTRYDAGRSRAGSSSIQHVESHPVELAPRRDVTPCPPGGRGASPLTPRG